MTENSKYSELFIKNIYLSTTFRCIDSDNNLQGKNCDSKKNLL